MGGTKMGEPTVIALQPDVDTYSQKNRLVRLIVGITVRWGVKSLHGEATRVNASRKRPGRIDA